MSGYIGSKSSVTLVDGYTQTEADAEFVQDPNGAITVSGSNVGIGTSSPSAPLHVSGGGTGSVIIDGTDSIRPSTDSSLITISGGNATNSGANYSMFGGSHASLANVHRWRTGGTERMRIDATGAVTMPAQPKIVAVGSSSAAKSDYSTGEVISYWSIVSSVGILHSNGRFTVPASGTYFVTFNLYTYLENNGHEHHSFHLHKNGSVFGRDQHEVTSSMFSGTGVSIHRRDRTAQATFVVDLSANDFVEVKNANAADMYLGSTHNHFSMFMLG